MRQSIQVILSGVLLIASLAVLLINTSNSKIHRLLQFNDIRISDQIDQIVKDDFENLLRTHELPKIWFRVSNYKVTSKDSYSYALSNKQNSFKEIFNLINQNPKDHYAEIEIIDVISEDEEAMFILQISLFETKSKNKVFEISRKYNLSDLGKKKPD